MKKRGVFEMLKTVYQSTRCYISEDLNLRQHCCENLKSGFRPVCDSFSNRTIVLVMSYSSAYGRRMITDFLILHHVPTLYVSETVLFRYVFIASFKILVMKVISVISIYIRIPCVRTRHVPYISNLFKFAVMDLPTFFITRRFPSASSSCNFKF